MARQGWRSSADGPANASMYDRFIVCQAGRSWRACVRRAGTMGLSEDDGFWSAFAATSEVEQLQASTMQKNTGIQLLLKILQERRRADGAVERARGIADRMAGREDERPPPVTVPRTVSCRAPFLVFLIHQRFSDKEKLVVASGERDVVNGSSRGVRPCLPGRPYDEYARALRVLCVHTLPCTVCSPLYSRRTELALLPGAFRALPRSRGWPRIQLCGCRAALAILGVLSPQLSDVGHVEVGCLRLQEQEFCAVRPAQLDPALGSSPASAWGGWV